CSWSMAVDPSSLPVGSYTFYAVATDAAGVKSAVASATLTVTASSSSGALLAWDVAGQSAFGTQGLKAGTVDSHVSNTTGLTRGVGVSTSGTGVSGGWGGAGWSSTSSAGLTAGDYVTFGLTVATGQTVSLSSIDLTYRRSSTGPTSGLWQYQ